MFSLQLTSNNDSRTQDSSTVFLYFFKDMNFRVTVIMYNKPLETEETLSVVPGHVYETVLIVAHKTFIHMSFTRTLEGGSIK